jgi:hypothetical protein
MERVIVIGNCQAKGLEMMLATNRAFAERFEPISFPAVHEIPDEMVPALHEAVAGAALLITQRVEEGYRNGLGLGTETLARIADRATVVRWPSVYWAGYVPDLFYLRNAAGEPVIDGPFDYHDRVILRAFDAGLGVAEVCRELADPERPSDAQALAQAAIAELEVRGRDCDVDVASFIASEFRDDLLFFTVNHPSNRLLGFVAQQITDLIELPGRVDHRQIPTEVLGTTFYPLHANHVRALGLAFGAQHEAGRASFRIRGVTYGPARAVQAFFDYYAEHPPLVELNLDPHPV